MTRNRYLYIFFLGVCFSLIWASCSNDFEVNAPAKDVPIVYGFLSLEDDVQYLRIERAFIGDGVSALDLAQREGEIYYGNEVSVSVTNLRTGEIFPLERTDVAALGLPREEGLFLTDPNVLYSVPTSILQPNENDEYQLTITRGGGLDVVTATTSVVGQMSLRSPTPVVGGPRNIAFVPDKSTRLSLREAPANGVLFDAIFIIKYQERLADGTVSLITKNWNVINNADALVSIMIPGRDFYSFLSGVVGETPAGLTRRILTIDVKIVAGGQSFSDYQRIISANAGITGAEDAIPSFTNLSEGLGIFSSRNELLEVDFTLTGESIDSIINNELTRDLNFVR